MSLIAGIVERDPGARADGIDCMLQRQTLFTADGRGTLVVHGAAFGHVLLANTPEDLFEHQPLTCADGRFVLTADARLDNRSELLDRFRIDSTEAPQTPDSALIAHAWLEWGRRCPEHLLGDFAFTVWDTETRALFCARDRMGVRPFYYHAGERRFGFASTVKGLFALPDVPRRLNETALADHLVLLEEDKASTFYQDIHRLPPAQTLTLNAEGRLTLARYWALDPNREIHFASRAECYEAVSEVLMQAVERRLRSRHPSAVMLSGGLDSSAVACLAARHLDRKGQRLTAVGSVLPDRYDGPEFDEREYMERVVNQESNIDFVGVTASGANPFTGLEEMLHIQDGPFRDLFHYMTTALLETAKERGARNIFWGFGGDHLVSSKANGYLAELARQGHWIKLSRETTARARVTHQSLWTILRGQVVSPFMPPFVHDAYHRLHGRLPRRWIDQFAINPGFAERTKVMERLNRFGFGTDRQHFNTVRAEQHWNMNSGVNAHVMEFIAHAAASMGLTVHTPYFDKDLVELCLAINPGLKRFDGWGRLLLRQSMDGYLPKAIQWRVDKGPFTPDFDRRVTVIRSEITHSLEDVQSNQAISGYFNLDKMRRVLDRRADYQVGFHWNMDTSTGLILPLTTIRWLKQLAQSNDS